MRKLIELTSEVELDLIQRSGLLGSLEDKRNEAFLRGILNILKDVGVEPACIAEIKDTACDRYIIFDYTLAIHGGSTIPDGADNSTIARWKALRDFCATASPDAIKQFLWWTSTTRCGAFTARQQARPDSTSLNAMEMPAARKLGPLVTRCRSLTVAKVDSIGFGGR
jgi:hypothetical protein